MACRTLAISSALPRRSPTLPLELISHIITLAQHPTNFGERQQTNFALSRVSRDVYRLVRPILRRELHITEAWQFSRLAAVMASNRKRFADVRTLSAILHPGELQLQDDGSWHGRFFRDSLSKLMELASRHEGSSLHLRTAVYPPSDVSWYDAANGEEDSSLNHLVEEGVILDELSIEHGFDNEVDRNDFDMYYTILALGPKIKHFHFGGLKPCREWREVYIEEGLEMDPEDWAHISAPGLE